MANQPGDSKRSSPSGWKTIAVELDTCNSKSISSISSCLGAPDPPMEVASKVPSWPKLKPTWCHQCSFLSKLGWSKPLEFADWLSYVGLGGEQMCTKLYKYHMFLPFCWYIWQAKLVLLWNFLQVALTESERVRPPSHPIDALPLRNGPKMDGLITHCHGMPQPGCLALEVPNHKTQEELPDRSME